MTSSIFASSAVVYSGGRIELWFTRIGDGAMREDDSAGVSFKISTILARPVLAKPTE